MAMTVEEARTMLGTEFDYFFKNGDHIRAYVKAFDPEIGLTCFSLGLKTNRGYKFDSYEGEDGDCMIGVDLKNVPGDLQECLDKLTIIRDTGKYTQGQALYSDNYGSSTQCAFSK